MELFYVLLVLLVATRIFGEVAVRLGQPALVGELVSGIVLGQMAAAYAGTFPVLDGLTDDKAFRAITDLGVFFLMLLAGIEMRPREMVRSSGSAFVVALFGLVVPLGVGFGIGWWVYPESPVRFAQALFLGTALAITAVPVAVRILMDLGQLESRAGRIVVSAAVFDDVLSLVVLAVLTAVIGTGTLPDATGILLLVGRTLLFFAVTGLFGYYVVPRLGRRMLRQKSDELEFSFVLVVALAFAVLAEVLHLHFILGAFIAGLSFGRRTLDPETFQGIETRVRAVTNGFLAPIFFASIGMHLDLSALGAVPGFLAVLLAAAVLSKLVGAGVPGRLLGLSGRAAVVVGVAMSARGAVELVIADIALQAGLFEQPDPQPPVVAYTFSAVVVVAVATTLFVPLALRPLLGGDRRGKPLE